MRMSNELVQTGFFDVEEVRNSEPIQVTYDYSRVTPEQAEKLEAIYNRMFMRHLRTAYEDGKDLLEAKNTKNLPYDEFTEWAKACYGWSKATITNKMNAALNWGDFSPTVGLIEDRAMYLLSSKRVPESARQEAKALLNAGEDISEELAKQIRDKHKAEIAKLEDEKKQLQSKFDFYKQDAQQREESLNARIDELEEAPEPHPTSEEERQKLEEDLAILRKEKEQELKETKKNLEEYYAKRDQERQFKAENTIRSLLSHGVKSMAETELTLDHVVSYNMLQAVLQLGGKQLDSFLAQVQSLREALDRVETKLTSSDSTDIVEASVDNSVVIVE